MALISRYNNTAARARVPLLASWWCVGPSLCVTPRYSSSQQVIRPAASTQMDKEIIRQLPELGRLKILFEAATQGRTDGIKLVRTALESFAHAP